MNEHNSYIFLDPLYKREKVIVNPNIYRVYINLLLQAVYAIFSQQQFICLQRFSGIIYKINPLCTEL